MAGICTVEFEIELKAAKTTTSRRFSNVGRIGVRNLRMLHGPHQVLEPHEDR